MMSRNARRAVRILGLTFCASAALATGCKKTPPPPPPPPPAREEPPPPPPPVSFEALGQELKADRRISAAKSIEVTDVAFARAAVQLADAIARGDNAKAATLMTRRAGTLLEELVATGEWADQTKNIEAVRIVYAASPIGSGDMDRTAAVDQLVKEGERQLAAFKSDLESRLVPAEEMQRRLQVETDKLKAMAEVLRLETDTSNIAERPRMVMLLAIQDQRGSYLLGWGGSEAGGTWIFNNVSTIGLLRRRAQDWDGIGMLGFAVGAADTSSSSGAPGAPGAPGNPGAPAGPRGG